LLLNSDRGAGGVVVSKEEVAPGRKGSGGAWGSTSRNAGLAGLVPQNGRIRTLAKKTSQAVDRWAVGCNLVVLKRAYSQSGCKNQRHFSVSPYEQFKVLSAYCFGLNMRCVSFYFERSCPEQRPRATLKPQEPHSSGPWTRKRTKSNLLGLGL
jgi:hypothetical protein